MVRKEKIAGGGGTVPGAADGAATEEGSGGQADEDIPYDDLLWEATEERRRSCRCGPSHGRVLRALHPSQGQRWSCDGGGGI